MRITLSDARTFLAPYVGTGLVKTNPKVVDGINEAVMRLIPKMPAEGTMARFRFWINNGTITMPREIQSIKKINIDDVPVNIFSRWYEFLSFGPGTMDNNTSSQSDFIDLGDGFCTHSDPHTPYNILVTASIAETDKRIRIMGLDENGLEVRSTDGPGEEVDINYQMNKYSTHKFSCITGVVKPQTNGYVYLSLYNVDPLLRYNLATYHPDETNPSYRRYRVTGICQCKEARTNCYLCAFKDTCAAYTNCMTTADSTVPPYTCVSLAKLRYIPLTYNTDPLLIQNLPALKAMLQGIRYFDAGDIKRGATYEGMAVAMLTEQLNDIEPQSNQIDIESSMPVSIGGVM